MKVLGGKYSLKVEGKDVFMQITPTENGLLLKQLWDGKEINFSPIIKSNDGSIAQLQAYNKDLWNRVNG